MKLRTRTFDGRLFEPQTWWIRQITSTSKGKRDMIKQTFKSHLIAKLLEIILHQWKLIQGHFSNKIKCLALLNSCRGLKQQVMKHWETCQSCSNLGKGEKLPWFSWRSKQICILWNCSKMLLHKKPASFPKSERLCTVHACMKKVLTWACGGLFVIWSF